jgi:hypothetical protein
MAFFLREVIDTNGWQDIPVANVPIASAINGIGACYVAFVPSGAAAGLFFLVDDGGDAGGPYSGYCPVPAACPTASARSAGPDAFGARESFPTSRFQE